MYILIVSGGHPSERYPTNGIFAFDQAKALKNQGHKVVFLSVDLRSIRRKRRFGKSWTNREGIDILDISIPLGRVPQSFLYQIGTGALNIIYPELIKKQGKPDIIHAHFTSAGYIAGTLKKHLKVPLVITEHSSSINTFNINSSLKQRAMKAYKNADQLISVSSALRNKILHHFNIESVVLHNIVNVKIFNYFEIKKKKSFTFLSVGNLIQLKAFDILIDAFHKANFDSNIDLKIIGKGPEYYNLQNQINNLGLNTQVKLLGFLSREEISKILQESNAFVLASRSETFGVAYIEAMAAGLPVIATKCGGPEDFVNESNGLLVPIDDTKSLADALKEMYNKIDQFDRKVISKECKMKFSPNTIATQLTGIYQSILK